MIERHSDSDTEDDEGELPPLLGGGFTSLQHDPEATKWRLDDGKHLFERRLGAVAVEKVREFAEREETDGMKQDVAKEGVGEKLLSRGGGDVSMDKFEDSNVELDVDGPERVNYANKVYKGFEHADCYRQPFVLRCATGYLRPPCQSGSSSEVLEESSESSEDLAHHSSTGQTIESVEFEADVKWHDDAGFREQSGGITFLPGGCIRYAHQLSKMDGERLDVVPFSYFPLRLKLTKRVHKEFVEGSAELRKERDDADGVYTIQKLLNLEETPSSRSCSPDDSSSRSSSPLDGETRNCERSEEQQEESSYITEAVLQVPRNLPPLEDSREYWFVSEKTPSGREVPSRWAMDCIWARDRFGTLHEYYLTGRESAEDILQQLDRLREVANEQIMMNGSEANNFGTTNQSSERESNYVFQGQQFPLGLPMVAFRMRHLGAMPLGFADVDEASTPAPLPSPVPSMSPRPSLQGRHVTWLRYSGIFV